ncbi:MAG: Maf family protein [Nocardioidaceae bacterium]
MSVVLASASSGRLDTLRRAGVHPSVVVSGVDEESAQAESPAALAQLLAAMKCRAVDAALAARTPGADPTLTPALLGREPRLVIGCDSILELDGTAYGKPANAEEAVRRWHAMRGQQGVLHTGHAIRLTRGGRLSESLATGSTRVGFADLTDDEIDAYVATGEPLRVAGAFTVDGLGGPFVSGIAGDPHNVVGISLPLLRTMLRDLGVTWPELWTLTATAALR